MNRTPSPCDKSLGQTAGVYPPLALVVGLLRFDLCGMGTTLPATYVGTGKRDALLEEVMEAYP